MDELTPLSIKSPVRSKLFFGTWDLVWSSKPSNGSRPRQILSEPNMVSAWHSLTLVPVYLKTLAATTMSAMPLRQRQLQVVRVQVTQKLTCKAPPTFDKNSASSCCSPWHTCSMPSSATACAASQIREVTKFKSLGLLPGATTQIGELGAIDNNNFEVRALRYRPGSLHL